MRDRVAHLFERSDPRRRAQPHGHAPPGAHGRRPAAPRHRRRAAVGQPRRRTGYEAVSDTVVGPAALHLDLTLATWATDGLLAIFFFVIGLELKREIVAGELRNLSTAVVPIVAAVGGMLVPAGALRAGQPAGRAATSRGWAVPTATDIAFAVSVLAVVGRRLPNSPARVPAHPRGRRRPARDHRHRGLLHRHDHLRPAARRARHRRRVRRGDPARLAQPVAAGARSGSSPGRSCTRPGCTRRSPACCSGSSCPRPSRSTQQAIGSEDAARPLDRRGDGAPVAPDLGRVRRAGVRGVRRRGDVHARGSSPRRCTTPSPRASRVGPRHRQAARDRRRDAARGVVHARPRWRRASAGPTWSPSASSAASGSPSRCWSASSRSGAGSAARRARRHGRAVRLAGRRAARRRRPLAARPAPRRGRRRGEPVGSAPMSTVDSATLLIDGPWQHRFVAANGARFHAAVAGPDDRDAPLVVLLHGVPAVLVGVAPPDPRAGRRRATASPRSTCAAPAARTSPRRATTCPTLTNDVAGVIRSLGSSGAVVVGSGTGGEIAWAHGRAPARRDARRRRARRAAPARRARQPRRRRCALAACAGSLYVQTPSVPERAMTRATSSTGCSPSGAAARRGATRPRAPTYRDAARVPFAAHSQLEQLRWLLRSTPRLDGRRYGAGLERRDAAPGAADPRRPRRSASPAPRAR